LLERGNPGGTSPQGSRSCGSIFRSRNRGEGTCDARPFLNAAVMGITDHPPKEFKPAIFRRIEAELGRVRDPGGTGGEGL
jgi:7,8-dihydro-6-hydroxymethylpterin-pyrophosphokinase